MNKTIERKLDGYLFPVVEKAVYVDDDSTYKRSKHYKAIVREDNGKLISIMKDTYQLVPNHEVIMPLLEQLHNLDTKWIIDPSHSFVQDDQMRLMITFPNLTFSDGQSDIALSLFLNNSYSGISAVKLLFGSIRLICSNGAIYGSILKQLYRKHTSGFEVKNLCEQIESTYNKIPVIQHRIEQLQNTDVTPKFRRSIEDQMGKQVIKYVDQHEQRNKRASNLWMLFNIVTYYISHLIEQRKRAQYQLSASRLFEL